MKYPATSHFMHSRLSLDWTWSFLVIGASMLSFESSDLQAITSATKRITHADNNTGTTLESR